MDILNIFNDIHGAIIIWVVLLMTTTDVILGIMNGLKQHHFKSSINRAGIINKCGVVICICFFYALDIILGLNGIGFSEIFGSTICLSELVSIIYNLKGLNVPFPKSFMDFFDKYTSEKKKEW